MKPLVLACIAFAATIAAAQNIIPPGKKFTPAGEIDMMAGNENTEKGVRDGLSYMAWRTDGSAFIQGSPDYSISDPQSVVDGRHWTAKCVRDPMTDETSCYVGKGQLLIASGKDGKPSIRLLGEVLVNSPCSIRIDDNKAHSVLAGASCGFDKTTSARILREARTGKRVRTQVFTINTPRTVESDMPTFGMPAAIDYLNWAVSVANKQR